MRQIRTALHFKKLAEGVVCVGMTTGKFLRHDVRIKLREPLNYFGITLSKSGCVPTCAVDVLTEVGVAVCKFVRERDNCQILHAHIDHRRHEGDGHPVDFYPGRSTGREEVATKVILRDFFDVRDDWRISDDSLKFDGDILRPLDSISSAHSGGWEMLPALQLSPPAQEPVRTLDYSPKLSQTTDQPPLERIRMAVDMARLKILDL